VQQEHGRPVAAAASVNGRRGDNYVEFVESLVHVSAQRSTASRRDLVQIRLPIPARLHKITNGTAGWASVKHDTDRFC